MIAVKLWVNLFAGDDVTVYGILYQRWKPFSEGSRCDVELILKANNIEVNNQHATASVLMEEAQKEIEDFWDSYKRNTLAGWYWKYILKKSIFIFVF